MRKEVRERGYRHGLSIISGTVKENGPVMVGECARCERSGLVVLPTWYDEDAYCEDCWVRDLLECEERWGTVSEHMGPLCKVRHRRAWRAYMAGVMAGVRTFAK